MASLEAGTAMATLTEDFIQTIQSTAKLLTGHKRRRFQAETALKYSNGSARQAEMVYGWERDAVHTGLNELRTDIRCLDAFLRRGRKKSEKNAARNSSTASIV